jgi:octaprenyl-diphosphate synthase
MDQKYTQRLEKIESILTRWLPEDPDPAAQSWMTHTFGDLKGRVSPGLLKSLTVPGWDLLNRGGKRWRPLLMTLICESLGGGDKALPLTPLVEFPHNASLIHDDIEDDSDERRGEPAIHIRYGIDTAINGGTFLYFLPLSCINPWDAPLERKHKVFNLWGVCMRRLHLGQAMDIQWHRDFSSLPSLEDYELMCRLKTGSLARLASALGVVAAVPLKMPIDVMEAEDTWAEKEAFLIETLGEAAEQLGMGFQILDDVKNLTTGNPGKKRGDDVVEGKKSLPVLRYLHRWPDKREWVARCFSAARSGGINAPEVEELIGALSRAGVLEEAADQGQAYITEAWQVFSRISVGGFETSPQTGDLLSDLLDVIGGDSMRKDHA